MRSLIPFQNSGLASPAFGHDMERLFNQVFSPAASAKREGALTPPLELSELEDTFVVRAELAGVDPADVMIELEDDVLSLSGEKKSELAEQEGGRSYTERRFGSFRRSIQLPVAVDPESVKATHSHGVVTVQLQKAAAQRSRRIAIEPA